jgi:dipeptidyl aminopeptidase/acylaminoacyl peptidase
VPVIFFQGLDDKVVLPSQTEMMVDKLRHNHLPVAYTAFPEEGHGFRAARNIERAIQAEWYFYSRILRFPLSEAIESVPIENLPDSF